MTLDIATTAQGQVRGVAEDGVVAFRGVPYAGSPAGRYRFSPPRPVEPWSAVRDAVDYAPSCPQPSQRPAGWSPEDSEDEDCLALNVWTPAAAEGRRRPVMVWIHGGGYAIGSGSWPLYNGANLARRGDVVVVTVNHRLGVLGYLHLGELAGPDYAASGNAGNFDLVASLEWVRDNIENFGGDPGNVTIFGESGGGAKVSALLAMPSARGLFHRAAVQSGPGLRVQKPDDAAEATGKLLAELGIAHNGSALEELQAVPVDRLVAAQIAVSPRPGAGGRGIMGGFAPVLDGTVLPEQPGKSLALGRAADIPVLVGCNRDEATLRLATDPILNDPSLLDEDGLRERLTVFGDRAEQLLAGYRAARPDASPLDLLIAIQSDSFMRDNTIRFAEEKVGGGGEPVFVYLFCWAAGPMRSSHGFEIAFVFDNVQPPIMQSSPRRTELASRMSDAWIAFARTGDPNHEGLPDWPAYSVEKRPTMIFDTGTCAVEDDPFGAERALWRDA